MSMVPKHRTCFLVSCGFLYSFVHVYSVCGYASVHLHVNACICCVQQLPLKLTSKVFNSPVARVIIDPYTFQLTHLTTKRLVFLGS